MDWIFPFEAGSRVKSLREVKLAKKEAARAQPIDNMPLKRRKKAAPLAAGPQAVFDAIKSIVTVANEKGDAYSVLRKPSSWPTATHDVISDAWKAISEGAFEVQNNVVAANLEVLRGLPLIKGFKVRLPDGDYVKGSSRTDDLCRHRDFVDCLVMVAEKTLARDAMAASKGKKGASNEQRMLRQHLGLPRGTSAVSKCRLPMRDLQMLFANGGVDISKEELAKLVAVVGGPFPDVQAQPRSVKQPVPYLEAELLVLSTLSPEAIQAILKQPAPAPQVKNRLEGVAPVPEWHDLYMQAALEYEAAPGPMQKNLVRMTMLPEQDRPVSVQKSEIETWWKGQAYEDWPMEVS